MVPLPEPELSVVFGRLPAFGVSLLFGPSVPFGLSLLFGVSFPLGVGVKSPVFVMSAPPELVAKEGAEAVGAPDGAVPPFPSSSPYSVALSEKSSTSR